MKIAIIGLGAIGASLAKNLTRGGADVMLAQRDQAKAEALAASLVEHATPVSIETAVRTADVLVLAIWFEAIEPFIQEHRADLAGKIVVDPSNPIAADGKGGFTKTLPADESSGEVIAALLPADTRLVKAFGSLSAASLAEAAHRTPGPAVLFYASDDAEAGRTVAHLISMSGFEPVSIGGVDQSIRIEVFGDLHEFGKLGKLVTRDEAAALLKSSADT